MNRTGPSLNKRRVYGEGWAFRARTHNAAPVLPNRKAEDEARDAQSRQKRPIYSRTGPEWSAVLFAFVAGAIASMSVPPFGWWPLGFVGIGILAMLVDDVSAKRRFALGGAFGLGLYGISLWWMTKFSLPGGLFVAALEATFTGIGMLAVNRRHSMLTFPAGLVLADALRCLWPFGGLPLGGIDLGQADGPLSRSVAFGGRLFLIGLVAVGGVALTQASKHKRHTTAGALAGLVAVAGVLTTVLPDGTHKIGTTRIAIVQGGGPRGIRNSEQGSIRAYNAHVAANALLKIPVDIILWPENAIAVGTYTGSREEREIRQIAINREATTIVGVVEDAGQFNFRNESISISKTGKELDRFDKVRRVPYGEYFPGRDIIKNLAEIPGRDAIAGTKVGLIKTDVGPMAISISYEGFFDDRSRGGVRAGGQAILLPTNASSYVTSQVPTQQIAAARLRALESGRWLAQAAPTGLSAFINNRGELLKRTVIEKQQVITETIELRSGLTPYMRTNDVPALLLMTILLALGWPMLPYQAKRRAKRRGNI